MKTFEEIIMERNDIFSEYYDEFYEDFDLVDINKKYTKEDLLEILSMFMNENISRTGKNKRVIAKEINNFYLSFARSLKIRKLIS